MQALRDKMSFPDLGSILDARTTAATVGVKTTVREAAKLMRERHTTAVCVMEADGKKIAGIFTSKDVVLRVIAAGLDAKSCSVVRVMTPHPDVALPSLTIQDALRKMHDGHYLNLPVVGDDGSLVGIVDVLKLTYATLETVNSISAEQGGDSSNGPAWGRLFGGGLVKDEDDDGTESVVSGAGQQESIQSSNVQYSTPIRPSHNRNMSSVDTPGSELFPNDSASALGNGDDGQSDVGGRKRLPPSSVGQSNIAPIEQIVDDGTYLFKFVAPGGTTHRFQARYDSHEFVTEIVGGKLASDPFFSNNTTSETGVVLDPTDFKMSYLDDDGDMVLMTADRDVEDAVSTARKQGKDRVVIHLTSGSGWEDELIRRNQTLKEKSKNLKVSSLGAVDEEGDDHDEAQVEKREAVVEKKKSGSVKKGGDEELVLGFLKKEHLLPASIGFLGVVIIGVFAISKAGGPAAGR